MPLASTKVELKRGNAFEGFTIGVVMGDLKFGWVEKIQKWLVNATDDQGICRVLNNAGAKLILANNKWYWAFENGDGIAQVRDILIACGYEEFSASSNEARTQASYRVGASSDLQKTRVVGGDNEFSLVMERAAERNSMEPAPRAESLSAMRTEKTYTVVEVAKRIKRVIENDMSEPFWVRGEVTGFKISSSGHVFFTLVEDIEESGKKAGSKDLYQLAAYIWRSQYEAIMRSEDGMPEIKDGVKVRVHGRVSSYEVKSTLALHIDAVDPNFAEGEFIRRRAEIYHKLEAMGIHDRNAKLPMPIFPLRIALFSNSTAAGYDDFINKFRESGYPYRITLFPVALQGREVESSFREMFEKLDSIGVENFDIGVIVRGGGSVTDLSYFNNLYIAEWLARSPLKFLIGIGHNRDYSVLDMIGYRLMTPTDVGVELNRYLDERARWCDEKRTSLENALRLEYESISKSIKVASLGLANATSQKLRESELKLSGLSGKLERAVQKRVLDGRSVCERLRELLKLGARYERKRRYDEVSDIERRLREVMSLAMTRYKNRISELSEKLATSVNARLVAEKAKLDRWDVYIKSSDPRALFARGYVFVTKSDGEILRSTEGVACGDGVEIHLADGKIDAAVTQIKRNPNGL